MKPYNPGNILPFYTEGYSSNDRRWHRHKQFGTDLVPYGLPCPRTRLLPFQVYYDGAFVSIPAFGVYNPYDDTEYIDLPTTLLGVYPKADLSGFWVVYPADTDLPTVPDCGYWYFFLNVENFPTLVSEVMEARDMCGFEKIGLEIAADSCSTGDGNITFTLNPIVEAGDGTTYIIERNNGPWATIATNTNVAVTESLATESRLFRIQATTACGLIVTKEYTVTWDSGDGCATISIAAGSVSTNEAGILSTGPVWRLNLSNTTDKAQVLYHTGYKQYFYLPLPIWDVPEIERETEVGVNGLGEEIRRYTRTVERRGFEVADIPDYVLGFLTKAGDLDTITLEDAKLVDSLQPVSMGITNLDFKTPNRQGTALNVGRFYFEVDAETFQGCQEDYLLD